jgi:hypothetical protein
MVGAQLVASFCALGALLLVAGTAQAHPAASPVRGDTALIAAILRTAVREALYTAHGAEPSQVVCVAIDSVADAEGPFKLIDPPASVIADLQRGRSLPIRASSTCRRLPPDASRPRTPLFVDGVTGKRGIRVWMRTPHPAGPETFAVNVGYDEHELSGGWWRCTMRERSGASEVAGCQLLGIA